MDIEPILPENKEARTMGMLDKYQYPLTIRFIR